MVVRNLSFRAAACVLAFTAVAAFTPDTSRAGTVSTTYDLTPLTLDGFQFGPHDLTVNATDFNPTLGTLNSIDVDWSVTNSFTATQTSGNIGDDLESQSSGPVAFDNQFYDSINLVNLGSATQFNVPFTFSVTKGTNSVTQLINGVNIFPVDFQGAIGTGTVPVEFHANVAFDGANSFSNTSTTISGNVKVSYNFTPPAVPLPSSLNMGLLGMGVLGLLRFVRTGKKRVAFSRVV